MDGENLTGEFREFMGVMSDDGATAPPAPPDAPDQSVAEPTAADSAAAEDAASSFADDADLTPDERVAAALGLYDADTDEGQPLATEAETEADDDAIGFLTEDEDEAVDLSALSPEQLRALAEEALRLREANAERDITSVHAEVATTVASAESAVRQRIEGAFQQEVIAVANAHYGRLIDEAIAEVIADSQRQTRLDPERYIEQMAGPRVQRIVAAQTVWVEEKRAEWAPHVSAALEQAAAEARKSHPGMRRLFASWLADEHNLPARAIDELLKEPDTDRMPERAKELVAYRNALLAVKRKGTQEVREEAAKRVADARVSPPATGRPAPAKVTPIKGDIDEWLSFHKATSA